MSKVGLYFGTFNPIHVGHVIIANYMAEFTDLDEVWLVVTPHNPFKNKNSLLNNYDRLEMVNMAVEGLDKVGVSDIEFYLKQPSYTIHTLVHLKEKHPSKSFHLIMGEDNLSHFHKWKNYEEILENHDLYVYPRRETFKPPLFDFKNKVHKVEAPMIELSSTFIRNAIKEGRDVSSMLSDKVWKYICEMNFYKKI